MWFRGDDGSAGVRLGLGDPGGLFQALWFCQVQAGPFQAQEGIIRGATTHWPRLE